jgi:hypothetical protein
MGCAPDCDQKSEGSLVASDDTAHRLDADADDTGLPPAAVQRRKVLTIMADTPTLDLLWPDSAYSLAARVGPLDETAGGLENQPGHQVGVAVGVRAPVFEVALAVALHHPWDADACPTI